MSYAGKFLKAYGQACTILRGKNASSYVSMSRIAKSVTEPRYEGLILKDSGLTSGECFQAGSKTYLVQKTEDDAVFGETAFFCIETNLVIQHKRQKEEIDSSRNVETSWKDVNSSVCCFGEAVTGEMRMHSPGLLEGTKWVIQASKSNAMQLLDRIVLPDGKNLKVISADSIGLPGVIRVQLDVDLRG